VRVGLFIWAVRTEWTRHLHEMFGARLAVITRWAFFTAVGQIFGSFHSSKVAFRTLVLNTCNTVRASWAAIRPFSWIIMFLSTKESVRASVTGSLTPHTVRFMRTNFETWFGCDRFHAGWNRSAIFFTLI